MDVITSGIFDSVLFSRTAIGLITRPYETYRRIVERGRWGELAFAAVLLCIYFALASFVKVNAFRPFLLTRQFAVLYAAAVAGFLAIVTVLWLCGRLLRQSVRLQPLAVAWGYTLVPTFVWFLATSLLYVILPPPRTTSVMGVTFSVVFLVFSATLLWWKIMLSYLTIRFALKLTLFQTIAVFCVVVPVIFAYSALMYRVGVFKVPFL